MYLQKVISKKKYIFCWHLDFSWRSLMKRAVSGVGFGSVSQRFQIQYQNVMDPEHCFLDTIPVNYCSNLTLLKSINITKNTELLLSPGMRDGWAYSTWHPFLWWKPTTTTCRMGRLLLDTSSPPSTIPLHYAAGGSQLIWKKIINSSVVDPKCLSIQDPDFNPTRISDPGSKNSNEWEGWKKLLVVIIPSFVATNFKKL